MVGRIISQSCGLRLTTAELDPMLLTPPRAIKDCEAGQTGRRWRIRDKAWLLTAAHAASSTYGLRGWTG